MCDKYNGWSNYQTWVFNLWYDDFFREIAQDIYDVQPNPVYDLADHIKETANELLPDDASVSSDLFGHAVGMIDFYEIAQAYIDEIVAESKEVDVVDFVNDNGLVGFEPG